MSIVNDRRPHSDGDPLEKNDQNVSIEEFFRFVTNLGVFSGWDIPPSSQSVLTSHITSLLRKMGLAGEYVKYLQSSCAPMQEKKIGSA